MDLDSILGILFFIVFVVLPLFSGANRRGQGRRGQGAGQGRAQGPATGAPSAGGRVDEPPVTLAEIRRRVEEAQRREEELARARRTGGTQPGTQRPGSLVTSDPFEGSLVSTPERRLGDLGRQVASLGPEGSPVRTQPSQPPTGHVLGSEGAMPDPFSGGYVIGREGAPPPPRPSDAILGREGATISRRPGDAVLGREGSPPPARRGQQSTLLGREGPSAPVRPSVAPSVGTRRTGGRSARAAAAEIGRESNGARPGARAGKATLGRAWALRTDDESILAGLVWHEVLSRPRALRHWRER